jgi:regulation of enolase protein 1 (concanavalin A-like superfamily)
MNFEQFYWINPPQKFTLDNGVLKIQTDPKTDFWQQTHYGFSKANAPAFLTKIEGDFTFSVKNRFKTQNQYDQCGMLLYTDYENWVKASVEHENEQFARLGSVVTNLGYSDWATTDIPFSVNEMSYRLSLKGQDVFIEYAEKDSGFTQMRILHLHKPLKDAGIGVYACSPQKSSFEAVFTEFNLGPCKWSDH